MVLPSPRVAAAVPGLEVPAALARRLSAGPEAGVEHACQQIAALREHGGFAGVHLVVLRDHADVAARVAQALPGRKLATLAAGP